MLFNQGMMTEWTTVVNSRKLRRKVKLEARRLEREKWGAIIRACPHVIVPQRAERLQQRLNIDNLKDRLLSDEWINYQKQGWVYLKTVKSQRLAEDPIPFDDETTEYSTLELNNGWGDRALFYRQKAD